MRRGERLPVVLMLLLLIALPFLFQDPAPADSNEPTKETGRAEELARQTPEPAEAGQRSFLR